MYLSDGVGIPGFLKARLDGWIDRAAAKSSNFTQLLRNLHAVMQQLAETALRDKSVGVKVNVRNEFVVLVDMEKGEVMFLMEVYHNGYCIIPNLRRRGLKNWKKGKPFYLPNKCSLSGSVSSNFFVRYER